MVKSPFPFGMQVSGASFTGIMLCSWGVTASITDGRKEWMKTSFVISERVSGFLKHGRNFNDEQLEKVIQASEAALNDRKLLDSEELGMKNKRKESAAESAVLARYRQQLSVVTAWIEYSQAGVGRVDRMATKAEKLGVVCTVADIPSTFAGQAIGEWVSQFGPGPERPVLTDEEKAKAKADAEAKAQKAKAKAEAKAKRSVKPADTVEAGQSNGQH